MKKNNKISFLFILFFVMTALAILRTDLNAEPATDKSVVESVFGLNDKKPPNIQLNDLADSVTVYTDKLYISGQVIDDGIIKALMLNGNPVNVEKGQSISFSSLVDIDMGKNTITVETEDRAGNMAKKEIAVTRKSMQLSQLPAEIIDKRMRLAVYPFDQKGVYSEQSRYFQDLLNLALEQQNRFNLVDRKIMARILEEQNLSNSELVDRNAAINVGKMMSAQAIITGSISETDRGIEIVGRMIDTETSKILVTEKIYSMTGGFPALKFLAESIVVNFVNDMPMLQGIVIKHNGGQIFTDLGQDRIALHGRLIIYRDISPDAGKTSGKSIILGHARVTQVFRDMSKAELIEGNLHEIKELDRIIVQ